MPCAEQTPHGCLLNADSDGWMEDGFLLRGMHLLHRGRGAVLDLKFPDAQERLFVK